MFFILKLDAICIFWYLSKYVEGRIMHIKSITLSLFYALSTTEVHSQSTRNEIHRNCEYMTPSFSFNFAYPKGEKISQDLVGSHHAFTNWVPMHCFSFLQTSSSKGYWCGNLKTQDVITGSSLNLYKSTWYRLKFVFKFQYSTIYLQRAGNYLSRKLQA